MLRLLSIPTLLLAGAALFSTGCRACSSCHDYDPPVDCCQCGTCDGHRAGSAFGGCGCNPSGMPVGGEVVEGEYVEGEAFMGQPAGPSTGGSCPCEAGN